VIRLGAERPAHDYACSRAGCTSAADWAIHWRNPKIHSEDRRKTWLACEEHLDYLRGFISDRSFPMTVCSIEELAAETPGAS